MSQSRLPAFFPLHFERVTVVVICLLVGLATLGRARDETPVPAVGLVVDAPESGFSVSTELGHMVSYQQKIPGTDVIFDMVPIPGGTAKIGSPDSEPDRSEDEAPQIHFKAKPFWIGKYEVTWAEYKQFMNLCDVFEEFEDRGIRPVTEENKVDAITAPSKLYDPSFTFQSGEDPRLPAVSMSQYSAKQFTKWLSLVTGDFYRLPTEAEWEYACRAGATTAYGFGNEATQLDDYAWHTDNSDWEAHLVGQKKPNAWGLYDMHGNVAEWVLDQYDAGRYAGLQQGAIPADKAILWPTVLYPRVIRGGSWDDNIEDCRCAARGQSADDEWRSYDPNSPQSPWWFASDDSQDVGFRIVRPLIAPPKEEWHKYWDADLEEIESVANFRIDEEGRGERGIVDPQLPEAIRKLSEKSPEE